MRGRTIALLFVAGVVVVGAAVASVNGRWTTHLQGDQEFPAVDTLAQGQAIFKLSDDGTTLHYKLIASNIQNSTQAHTHLRASASAPTGGIVVWLYPSAPPLQLIPGRHDGELAEGDITPANFVGALAGKSMSDLLAALDSGLAYANGHTAANPPRK